MSRLIPEIRKHNYLVTEINAAYHKAAQKLGISDSAMIILYFVCDNNGKCLLNDICRLSGVSKQTVNSSLHKLEADGFVTLDSSGGKKKMVVLTEKGKKYAEEKVVPIMEIENEIFGEWKKEELDLYLSLSQRYLNAFKDKTSNL